MASVRQTLFFIAASAQNGESANNYANSSHRIIQDSTMKLWLALLMMMPVSVTSYASDSVSDASAAEAVEGAKRIYRIVDEHGNTVFTDSPPEHRPVEEVELKPLNTVRGQQTRRPPQAEEPEPVAVDYKLVITSPVDQAVFHNPTESLAISVSVEPDLESGHVLRVLHNGAPLSGFQLPWLDRGEHRFQAVVDDAKGKRLSQSLPVVIYVHRASVMMHRPELGPQEWEVGMKKKDREAWGLSSGEAASKRP